MAFFLTNSDTSLRRAAFFASSFGTCVTRFIGRRGGLEVNSSWYPDLTTLVTHESDVTARQLSANWLNRPPTGGYSLSGTIPAYLLSITIYYEEYDERYTPWQGTKVIFDERKIWPNTYVIHDVLFDVLFDVILDVLFDILFDVIIIQSDILLDAIVILCDVLLDATKNLRHLRWCYTSVMLTYRTLSCDVL